MTSYLIEVYGKKRVVDYLKLFKKNFADEAPLFRYRYKTHVKEIFGIEWEENEEAFDDYVKEEIAETKSADGE